MRPNHTKELGDSEPFGLTSLSKPLSCSPACANANTKLQYEHSMCMRRAQLAPGSEGKNPNAYFDNTSELITCPSMQAKSPTTATSCNMRTALYRPRNNALNHLRLSAMCTATAINKAMPTYSWGTSWTSAVAITTINRTAMATSTTTRTQALCRLTLCATITTPSALALRLLRVDPILHHAEVAVTLPATNPNFTKLRLVIDCIRSPLIAGSPARNRPATLPRFGCSEPSRPTW